MGFPGGSWVWLVAALLVVEGEEINPCDSMYLGVPKEPCTACDKNKWNLMMHKDCVNKRFFGKGDRCDGELIIEDSETIHGCYNDNPVISEYMKEVETLIAKGIPDLKVEEAALGFNIPENPFLRYFLPPDSRVNNEHDKYDIGLVKDLYVGPGGDTDFELFEWPGKSANQMRDLLDTVTLKNYGCPEDKKIEIKGTTPVQYRCDLSHNFTMLHYDGETSKFLNYKCNKQLGTNIVAFGQVQQTIHSNGTEIGEDLNVFSNDPIQKVWMSHGTQSIHRKYTQPVFIRQYTLRKMLVGKGVVRGDLFCKEDEDNIMLKLRTVYDFTFVTDGLVLGMHCGIVMLRGLLGTTFSDYVPTLTTRNGKYTAFPRPVNKLSSSVCCESTSACKKDVHIVAAYSYVYSDESSTRGEHRFLYVSFDGGSTFEEKFIAPATSLVNLIQSMYNMYERFAYYYQLLNRTQPFDDTPDLKRSQENKLWHSLNPEEQEAFVLSHIKTGQLEASSELYHDTLGRLYCHETLKLSNGFSEKKRVDYTPDWVKKSIAGRYAAFYKSDGFRVKNHAECLSVPECKTWADEHFTPDTIVTEIMKGFPPVTTVSQKENCKLADEKFNWAKKKEIFTEKREDHKPHCGEISSIVIIEEDQDVLVLCKMKFCEGKCSNKSDSDQSTSNTGKEKVLRDNIYGIYYLSPFRGIPISEIYDWSANFFECDLMKYRLGGEKQKRNIYIQPTMIRIPNSATFLIANCNKALYYTPDYGKTILSFAFYTKKFRETPPPEPEPSTTATEASTAETTTVTPPPIKPPLPLGIVSSPVPEIQSDEPEPESKPTIFGDRTVTEDTEWIRTFILEEMDVSPCIAVSGDGHRLLMTFKNFYAFGQINYKQTSRLRVGISFPKPAGNDTAVGKLIPEETIAVPWFKNSGDRAISISLMGLFQREDEYRDFYKNRHAIRFVEIPVSFYNNEAAFYHENRKVTEKALVDQLVYKGCTTFNFKIGPRQISLDAGESAVVSVSVTDKDQFTSLGVFAGSDKAAEIHVEKGNNSKGASDDIRLHDWDVEITMHPEPKYPPEHYIEAFFGAAYNILGVYSPTIVMQATGNSRCHVQPLDAVRILLGCHGKILVAHEDEHRPQRKRFIANKKYTIRKGMYNPELARYWIENNPGFVSRDENGDLNVNYDFSTFGIPIEPFKDDAFTPDLRIVDEKIAFNSTSGKAFTGDFILIEIFGATGFQYKWKVGDVQNTKCKKPPQTLKKMLNEWVHRRRIMNITAGRLNKFLHGNPESEGSFAFNPEPVYEHLNIWNRVNYKHCRDDAELQEELEEVNHKDSPLKSDPKKLKQTVDKVKRKHKLAFDAVKDDQYEIMNNRELDPSSSLTCGDDGESCNTIVWDSKNRPEVFIFLAVTVDAYGSGSICNYHTLFAVTLPKAAELDDVLSFLCFLFFTVLWAVIILLGYWWRKSRVRQKYVEEARTERLKQAAWTVIYRYEKLLHENENKELESEIEEFSKLLQERDREMAYSKMKAEQQSQPTSRKTTGNSSIPPSGLKPAATTNATTPVSGATKKK